MEIDRRTRKVTITVEMTKDKPCTIEDISRVVFALQFLGFLHGVA